MFGRQELEGRGWELLLETPVSLSSGKWPRHTKDTAEARKVSRAWGLHWQFHIGSSGWPHGFEKLAWLSCTYRTSNLGWTWKSHLHKPVLVLGDSSCCWASWVTFQIYLDCAKTMRALKNEKKQALPFRLTRDCSRRQTVFKQKGWLRPACCSHTHGLPPPQAFQKTAHPPGSSGS